MLRTILRFAFRGIQRPIALLGILLATAGQLQGAETERTEREAPEEVKDGLSLAGAREVRFETDQGTWMSLDVAPDGERIVVELLGDLYLLPIEGGAAVPLTRGMAFDSQPRFSPDGERVVFVSDRGGREDVWTIAADGSDPVKLTEGARMGQYASPAYSPDGSHVVVSRTTWGLATYELWAHHVDGGKGVQLTRAKTDASTPRAQRYNALGAVYAPDGRYLYYAGKAGGFGYNIGFPQWQIVRRDLRTGDEDYLTQAQGSAFRPALSPDGNTLVYGTRYHQQTGLRRRDLNTGADEWLVFPVEHDEQESRFTRDLLPGYAFTPDGRSLIFTAGGGIRRLDLASGAVEEIPFTAAVEQALGPRLYFPYRLGLGPVKARLLMGPALSPDGKQLAFSAFLGVHVRDLGSGETRVVSPPEQSAFHPAWSPDGRHIAFVSWTNRGGHLWRVRADGRGRPRQVSSTPAFYTDPAWSPDGERILALRAASYDRLYREFDFGGPIGSDLVWFPSAGGAPALVVPSRGYRRPHFGPEEDRIYLYQGQGQQGLMSLRYDGTDRRNHLSVKGKGSFLAEEEVAADDVRLSPDGRHVLIHHANQLHLARLLNPNLAGLELSLSDASLPVTRLTDVGVDFFGWNDAGDDVFWTVGNQLYRRPLDGIQFREPAEGNGSGNAGTAPSAGNSGNGADSAADRPAREDHESVIGVPIDVYRPRHRPESVVALVGATVLPMSASSPGALEGEGSVISDATVLIEQDRITAVGPRGAIDVPEGAHVVDVSGHWVLPGFVDTHAHFRPLRRILDRNNWAFLANLAYGVTTGLDVQPSTTDIIAYDDLINAGLMLGPRALSTGPGIFNNNDFRSVVHAESVLSRYKDHYGVRNLKAYLAGDRDQRQYIVQAAAALRLMPTTEGGLDMKMDMTHVTDGFSGNEHNFPLRNLYDDTVRLVAESGIAYTPTLLVSYGGPWAENYFYTRESPYRDTKLRRFMPGNVIDARTQRTQWFLDEEFAFPALAAQAARIIRAGGRVGVGSHGQLQGLGYHWEMWALAAGGLTPHEVLTAATRHGAEMIGVAEDIGTVEAGKLADLVVLTEDPLEDLRHTTEIRYVVANGQLYDASTLDRLWPEPRPLEPQWWWNGSPVDSGSDATSTRP
jgi:Tol biopolymer transport system component